MDTLGIVLLSGLQKFGREKTFAQILIEASIHYTETQELEAAHKLESLGLIESITYQLPLEIRAQLTSYGKEYVEAIAKGNTRSGTSSRTA